MLSDTQRAKLKQVADDAHMLDALEAVFIDGVKGRMIDDIAYDGDTNEQIGAVVRARLDAVKLIREVLREIRTYQTVPDEPKSFNRAR